MGSAQGRSLKVGWEGLECTLKKRGALIKVEEEKEDVKAQKCWEAQKGGEKHRRVVVVLAF